MGSSESPTATSLRPDFVLTVDRIALVNSQLSKSAGHHGFPLSFIFQKFQVLKHTFQIGWRQTYALDFQQV